MKMISLMLKVALLVSIITIAQANTVGVQPLSVTVTEIDMLAKGWSVKKSIMGKKVYNEKNEVVGKVSDLVVAPDSSVSYAIVGVSRFLGVSTHDIAVPVKFFSFNDKGTIILEGANKKALQEMPKFRYKE